MRKTGTAALVGLVMALALGGVSSAQDSSPPKGPDSKAAPEKPSMPMAKGHMTKGMSDADTKTMMTCRGMHQDAMRKDKTCMDMMKAHHEMMKPK